MSAHTRRAGDVIQLAAPPKGLVSVALALRQRGPVNNVCHREDRLFDLPRIPTDNPWRTAWIWMPILLACRTGLSLRQRPLECKMNPLLLPFLTYSMVTIFTPGPGNISASALGARVGFRRAAPFISGMVLGYFLVLLSSAMLTEFLRANYSRFSGFVRWVGAAYIVWLAVSPFLSRHRSTTEVAASDLGFGSGFLLVLVNPKGILFAVTTFVSFSALLTGSIARSVASSAFLALLFLVAASLWAVVGAALSSAFKSRTFSLVFNFVMAVLLLYAAYSIVLH